LPARGGGGSLNVAALTGCRWDVDSVPPWIEIVSDTSGSGNDIISFEARENFAASARQGQILVSGQTLIVVQEGLGASCSYTVSPEFASFAVGGGSGSISIATGAGCGWQATSNQSWIMITSPSAGIGGATVNYSVSANTSGANRDGTITIGGRKIQVKQKGS
jgi:hypothetical protein